DEYMRKIILMSDNPDLQRVLAQIIQAHQQNEFANPSDIHLLAHHRYEPAKEFFIKCLNDDSEDWRYECLTALGFHFVLDEFLMEKVRHLSLHDENSSVRSCAASVWASQKQVIDHHLLFVLDNDPDIYVKEEVLYCILTKYIYQIRPLSIRDVKQKIRNGEIMLNVVGISKFLAGFGVKLLND
ncbi:MAG: hypothetical protein MUE54_07435, partial [Anaerolineae bacterium]|nr:hypothetical protein [Anaerolineae bacterium]